MCDMFMLSLFFFIYKYAMALRQFNYGSGNLNIYRNEGKKMSIEKTVTNTLIHERMLFCSFACKKHTVFYMCYHMYRAKERADEKIQPGPIFEFTIKC